MLAIPWAMSSTFELCRSPLMLSATTADNRLSTAASSATVKARGDQRQNVFGVELAEVENAASPRGYAAEFRADGFDRQFEERHGQGATQQRDDRARNSFRHARHKE